MLRGNDCNLWYTVNKSAVRIFSQDTDWGVFAALLFSLQGPKSEDDVADGAEADEADELSGYEPESDVNTMTVLPQFTCCILFTDCLVETVS